MGGCISFVVRHQHLDIQPIVTRITIYPVKSLDGISLQKAQVGKGGCLLHDREYAILDSNGKFINGKANALVHSLRSEVDVEQEIISLRHGSATAWNKFHLQKDIVAIDKWLSEFFDQPARLSKNTEGRYMDIPVIAGLTIVSTASLEAVAAWFSDMDLEETRKRFRSTIEISAVPAFWEDRLFAEQGTAIEFRIGDTIIQGRSPRARCIVPTRHPETGDVIHGFPKTFAKHRAKSLPGWSTLEDYGHSYYLTVNCSVAPTEYGKWIATGDELHIIGKPA
ncbi:MAG TPA: MOSC N-terminal beta barrel domain-containing protein [Ferruginibacter sp.]|nr:MOSC N-terminal beta barrel domain-containing protein [Ferruginibacter sp.]